MEHLDGIVIGLMASVAVVGGYELDRGYAEAQAKSDAEEVGEEPPEKVKFFPWRTVAIAVALNAIWLYDPGLARLATFLGL